MSLLRHVLHECDGEREKEHCAMLGCVLHECDGEKKTALWNVVQMWIDFGPAPQISPGSNFVRSMRL